MKAVFNSLSKYALARAILYIALGILMLVAPETIMSVIVYILAAYVLVMGALNIVNYFRYREAGFMGFELVSGILLAVLGILMFVFTRSIIAILPVFLGVLLVVGGISNLVGALRYGRVLGHTNVLLVVLDILVIIGGVVVVANPFASAVILFQIFGAVTAALGVGELISYFTYKRMGKDVDAGSRP